MLRADDRQPLRGSRESAAPESHPRASNPQASPLSPLADRLASAVRTAHALRRAALPSPPSLMLITDPGPDPDDVKVRASAACARQRCACATSPRCALTIVARDLPRPPQALLIAATMHRRRRLTLRAVVCNGGHQARERARLARCILDHLGEHDIPVGHGSEGKPYAPQPHEVWRASAATRMRERARTACNGLCAALRGASWACTGRVPLASTAVAHARPRASAHPLCAAASLRAPPLTLPAARRALPPRTRRAQYAIEGFADVPDSRLAPGGPLILRTLRAAAPGSLTVVCISSLRDLADAMAAEPELVLSRVAQVAVQGGLVWAEGAEGGGRWVPDTSVNNGARGARRERTRAPLRRAAGDSARRPPH